MGFFIKTLILGCIIILKILLSQQLAGKVSYVIRNIIKVREKENLSLILNYFYMYFLCTYFNRYVAMVQLLVCIPEQGALQKRILHLLRKIEHCVNGVYPVRISSFHTI